MSRSRLLVLATGVLALLITFAALTPATTIAAGAQNYHLESRRLWTFDACGIHFTGWIHDKQQYTITPTGQLNFHYIANAQAEGVDAQGNKASVKVNNKELDHVFTDPSTFFNNYIPTLPIQAWIASHPDLIVEINAQFNLREIGKGGKNLQYH